MIRKWGVSNFKSIKEADIELADLNIFTGINSSGKSSIIQSILLIAQTLRKDMSSDELALDGDFIKRGFFENPSKEDIGFHFCLPGKNRWEKKDRDFTLSFTNSDDQPLLHSFSYSFDSIPHGRLREPPHYAVPNPVRIAGKRDKISDKDFHNVICTHVENVKEINEIKYRNFSHFIPEVICNLKQDKETKDKSEELVKKYLDDKYYEPAGIIDILLEDDDSDESSIESTDIGDIPFDKDIEYVIDKYDNTIDDITIVDAFDQRFENVDRYYDKIVQDSCKLKMEGEYNLDGVNNYEAFEIVNGLKELKNQLKYFADSVRYLGPLRHDDSFYPLSSSLGEYIGARGEYTAFVIKRYADKEGDYISPPNEDSVFSVNRSKFKNALLSWIKYFGLVDDLDIVQAGNQAYQIKVKQFPNNNHLDITDVGKGVSQVLPILTMCLLADRDSITIIEQPEEQLHPKIQSKLADLFVAMALNGRQCIVETHSEYLIEQLRFRILKASNESLHDKTRLYFAEKRDGISSYKNIGISKYAEFDKWPEDFFDESHKFAKKFTDEVIKQDKLGD